MKTIPLHLTLTLLAGTVAAQEPRAEENGHRPPPLILAIFDTDRDGVLSAREIRKASDALVALDRNGDRQLTRDELLPPPPEGGDGPRPQKPPGQRPAPPEGGDGPMPPKPPGHRPPPPVIAALDTDRDGALSAEELKAAPESLLQLDMNDDGELSPEELHPHGPPPPPPDGEPMPEE
jgi:hypothetical protein